MARSISDVFARGESAEKGARRTARFLGPVNESQKPATVDFSSPTQQMADDEPRRAAYRPAENVALRRDVIEAFAAARLQDREQLSDESTACLLDAAYAAEALGEYEQAYGHLRAFERSGEPFSWESAFLKRRVLRGVGAEDLMSRSLKSCAELEDAPAWAGLYAGLERAWLGWTEGVDATRVRRRAERALRSVSSRADIDAFAALWAMQLLCDSALETQDCDAALLALQETIATPELNSEVRQALEARRAVWMHVFGRHDEARSLLDELAGRGHLPGDLDDLLVNLCFEAGDRGRAFSVLRSTARDSSRLKTHALPLVMLHGESSDALSSGRDVLREATEECDDWTLLRLREHLLDSVATEEGGQSTGAELIDVLNRRLEGPLSTEERVSLLTRLGRLYESEASLEEAAAEVYREALSHDPQHVPALRALGRLYTRRENWRGLAELYERELAQQSERSASWRRHFQLAELYEHRLQKDERALENYLIVLEEKPNYLPALKSSARILGRLERWTRLADLFLRMVDTAPSRRQKLYLLDKVAEVAEQRLENFEVAIGAWREILDLDRENPRAYTALGRLYARSGRWQDLIALNELETDLVEDREEIASILLRNAEIAEQHLQNTELAEQFYRRALNVIPDYLPALEALGRIYLRSSRWTDIVNMTGRELRSVESPEKATRQLGALAEILETRLDRRADAIAIYEELFALDQQDSHVFASLCRLYRSEGAFEKLEALLQVRLEQNPPVAEYAALQGELAILAEWKTGQNAAAYGRYLAALQCDPTNLHWLGGVARSWPLAGVHPSEVADGLEDLLMHATKEEVRDRYFVIIARLRERAEGTPEASRAYRAHGAAMSLENQIVLRLAMAAAGEREQLTQSRRAISHHPLQRALVVDRGATDEAVRDQLREERPYLSQTAKKWLSRELSPRVSGVLCEKPGLTEDLMSILNGEELYAEQESQLDCRRRLRLRALQARRMNEHEAYIFWTRQEIESGADTLVAARHLELARYCASQQLGEEEAFFAAACRAVFPELEEDATGEGEQIELSFEYPKMPETHVVQLYDALRTSGRWQWLRRCLEAQVARPDLDRETRLALFEELADVLRDELKDYFGARDALVHCWHLSEDTEFLRTIARHALQHGERDDALRFQKKHFEAVSLSSAASPAERVQSGIWLADMLLAGESEDELEAALDCLERLSESFDEVEGITTVRRMLARAHARANNARRAVELFEEVLHFQVRADELEDWRLLVEIHRHRLNDPGIAYTRQWALVRAFPDSQVDLDILVDLAAESGELADCIEQLSLLASATANEAKVSLLARAAEAADEELGHAEEAFRLFERVLELTAEDDERRIYYERRRAVCLARMAGREPKALEAFHRLVEREPFEPSNYRGMETLFVRANALDRLRVARQTLRMLGCDAEEEDYRGKVHPTRTLAEGVVENSLLPAELGGGLIEVLKAVMPLAEKAWSDVLPQRKAFDGRRIKSAEELPFYRDLQAALLAFGVMKFKLQVGESGPEQPMVFAESTPVVWVNEQLLEKLSAAESRFVAGYCAALVWSEVASLIALDGRQVWHLVEGVVYRQTGKGFTDRVDVQSQEMAERVSSPFDGAARKRVQRAVEVTERDLANCHCEAWGRQLEGFAARAGLLISGDVEAATRGLLRLGGWSLALEESATQRRIRNDEIIADLVRLAHTDDYLELRYKLGLAGRPSRLKV